MRNPFPFSVLYKSPAIVFSEVFRALFVIHVLKFHPEGSVACLPSWWAAFSFGRFTPLVLRNAFCVVFDGLLPYLLFLVGLLLFRYATRGDIFLAFFSWSFYWVCVLFKSQLSFFSLIFKGSFLFLWLNFFYLRYSLNYIEGLFNTLHYLLSSLSLLVYVSVSVCHIVSMSHCQRSSFKSGALKCWLEYVCVHMCLLTEGSDRLKNFIELRSGGEIIFSFCSVLSGTAVI